MNETTIMNYDPNLTLSGRMAVQKVRLTFAMWDKRATFETEVGGNCNGLSVIDCAVGRIYDELPTLKYRSGDEVPYIILSKGEDTLECEDEEDEGSDFLKNMLIAAEIMDIQPKKEGL